MCWLQIMGVSLLQEGQILRVLAWVGAHETGMAPKMPQARWSAGKCGRLCVPHMSLRPSLRHRGDQAHWVGQECERWLHSRGRSPTATGT